MSKHGKNCECDQCFRSAVVSAIDRWIENTVKENPGVVCPYCGTNPSKPAAHASGWLDWCGHEVRKEGLVIGWRKNKRAKIIKCTNSERTRELVYKNGTWIKQLGK